MLKKDDAKEKPAVEFDYLYCRACKSHFTTDSKVHFCPFCEKKGEKHFLVVRTSEMPVQTRFYIPMKKCTFCADASRCPDCFGSLKKQPKHCRICSCAACCNEAIEFAEGIRSGDMSLSQIFRDRIARKGIQPGPMAAIVGQQFDNEIPF
jgi:hypothetical protein